VEDKYLSRLSYPEFCFRHGLISSQLYKWRKDAKSGAFTNIKNDGHLHSKAASEVLRRENDELKKVLGEATLDIKVLKKAGDGSTTKPAVEYLSREFGLSIKPNHQNIGKCQIKHLLPIQVLPYEKENYQKNLSDAVKTQIRTISSRKETDGILCKLY